MFEPIADCDTTELLAAAEAAVRDRRLAEVRDLEVLAQWAAVHSSDPADGPYGEYARSVGNVLIRVGGEGTPLVQDFCLGEIAMARGTGYISTSNTMADVLDLQHRLPLTWAVVRAGAAEVFVARRIAKLSRHLSADRVGVVDTAVARIIARESGGRVLDVAEAKIIEADPGLHEERAEAERIRRYVGFSRTDEHGLRKLIARIEAADAVWIDATIARVAEIIEPLHSEATVDERRSIAMGYLARPAELLALLVEHSDGQRELALELDEADSVEAPTRATAFPADLLDALRTTDFSPLAPEATLYLHLHEAALQGVTGVARVEGLGPCTLDSLKCLLARTNLTVRPVLDLSRRVRTTAYEHPESLKERVHLTTGGDYWPFASSVSRRVDYDHPIPYEPTGPPGQTGTHNSGPLGRRHHRWKTHAGYRSRQSGQGRYAWMTPNGLGFLVDHAGTRRIDPDQAQMIIDAPEGVDIYPA